MAQSASWLAAVDKQLRSALGVIGEWLAREKRLEWVKPHGGCVCFPRIRADADVNLEKFYKELTLREMLVGPGHWFEQDRRYMRIGFGWPVEAELKGGLAAITESLDAAR